jgi:glutamate/tyrosine decarboxylase-like PLP-dependent enzyme
MRRNFRTRDAVIITPKSKKTAEFKESLEPFEENFENLTYMMKESTPFFSSRYIAHMTSDTLISANAGYFLGMLYNQNNVTSEASPVTTELEHEVARDLAELIGYDTSSFWGHITSGGTVANFEALWVARNQCYFPLAAKEVANEYDLDVEVALLSGEKRDIKKIEVDDDAFLKNSYPGKSPELREALYETAKRKGVDMAVIENALFEAGISGEGMHGYPRGAIFVPQTAHYSFKKIIEALGLGRKSLVYVDVDEDFKMSMEDLKARLEREDRKIIAVVPIVGTTEEGAVDPVDKIVEMRDKLAKEVGQSFFIHADAAYGGYAKTVSKDKLAAYVYNSLQALKYCDSVTIDPHKLGYVPYPTGAILFKDKRSRNFVICDAPYVFHGEPEVIGQYILEGSKPGAAAVACWLAHRSVPLNESGYGRIIGTTIDIIRNLEIRFETDLKDDVQVLVRPHLNMLCFRVNFKGVPCSKMNEINGRVYRYFLEGPDKDYPITSRRYFISETRLKIGEYKFLRKKLGLPEETRKEEEVKFLRVTIMNPYSEYALSDFVNELNNKIEEEKEKLHKEAIS